MTEITVEKIVFPSLYKFFNRSRVFNFDIDSPHTHITLFINVEKWCIVQWCFFGGSAIGRKGKNGKTVFVCYPKHWRYLRHSAWYVQTLYKIQLSFLCFGVPYYRTFFARIDVQNVGWQNSFWL